MTELEGDIELWFTLHRTERFSTMRLEEITAFFEYISIYRSSQTIQMLRPTELNVSTMTDFLNTPS